MVPWLASGLLTDSAFSLLLRVSWARKVGRCRDQDPSLGVVTQGLPEEEEEKDYLSQGDTMPGSFQLSCREPLLPWTEVVGKDLDDYLMLLCVKKFNFCHINSLTNKNKNTLYPTLSTGMTNTERSIHHLASSWPREIAPPSPHEISTTVSLSDSAWQNTRDSIVLESILSSKGQSTSSKLSINRDTWATYDQEW